MAYLPTFTIKIIQMATIHGMDPMGNVIMPVGWVRTPYMKQSKGFTTTRSQVHPLIPVRVNTVMVMGR